MDDNQADYAPDTTTHLIQLLKENLAYTFNTYFEATPLTPPPAPDFPVCIVQKMTGQAVIGPTQTDEVHETYQLTFILNIADDVGSANIRTTTMRHLQNIIEGQDPVNVNEYKQGTVYYVLRTFLTMGTWIINSDVTTKYDIIPKPGEPTLCVADVNMQLWRRVFVQRPIGIG